MKTIVDWCDGVVKQALDPSQRKAEIARLEKRLPLLYGVLYVCIALYGILIIAMAVSDSKSATVQLSLVPLLLMYIVNNAAAHRLIQMKIEERREECEHNPAPYPEPRKSAAQER